MFRWFEKEKWALVKTLIDDNIYSPTSEQKCKIFIHLYESSKGNRKISSACSLSEVSQYVVDKYVKSSDIYQTKIHRWVNGRYDPDIPRYSEIGQEDTANALKGKID